MFQDKYVFSQLTAFLNRTQFNNYVRKYDGNRYVKLKTPAKYGLVKFAYRGHCKTRAEFFKHCEDYPAIGKLEYLISDERYTSIPARPFAQQQPGVVSVQ